ncbi:hypothetical protein BIW11_12609 [Tropilaelaps mercedesae]|uniref:Uncharacterized protein n=1 Tax=Tropilaelaps mercedesae TaxID=418985 RepID=A0A1V9X5Y3_9ACAR|nr:hypothetical protein BIW11_12609 [Tropilaelaps mercedesae]
MGLELGTGVGGSYARASPRWTVLSCTIHKLTSNDQDDIWRVIMSVAFVASICQRTDRHSTCTREVCEHVGGCKKTNLNMTPVKTHLRIGPVARTNAEP